MKNHLSAIAAIAFVSMMALSCNTDVELAREFDPPIMGWSSWN